MARKTKLMQRVEKEFQRPLERLLPEKVNEVGLSATAEELGVSKERAKEELRSELPLKRLCREQK